MADRRAFVSKFPLLLFAAVSCVSLEVACLTTRAEAQPPRPFVIVFAGGQIGGASKKGQGLGATGAGGDALTASERSLRAAQAVRERLDDGSVFTTALYNPDAAIFVRAMQEGKIRLVNPQSPTAKERREIGKAAGAVYVVWVAAAQTASASSGPSGANQIEIELLGTDVPTGDSYSDRVRTEGALAFAAPVSTGSDSNGVRPAPGSLLSGGSQNNALLSAANTLVVRLLGKPLRDFAQSAPPPNLLPPPIAPQSAAGQVRVPGSDQPIAADTDALNSNAALSQAEGLLGAGDAGAAIVLLRKSVSAYPMNLPLRAALARAYSQKKRWADAASEARRALLLVPVPASTAGIIIQGKDRETRQELTRTFSNALRQSNDVNAARQAYEQIINDQPASPSTIWARLAYADMLLKQNKPTEAQTQLQAVLAIDSKNGEATALLARYYAAQGDFNAALTALSGSQSTPDVRSRAAAPLFDDAAVRLADSLTSNRAAWETGKITREAMYKATQAQSARATLLSDLLKSAPSPASAGSVENKAYLRRVHGASVLVQAISALLNLLDSGDRDAGDESTLLIAEFRREIAAAQNPPATPASTP